MDVKDMNFKPESFDCIIDKGLLDSVLVLYILSSLILKKCGLSSTANARYMLEEIYNKLAPGGTYICISHGTPEARM